MTPRQLKPFQIIFFLHYCIEENCFAGLTREVDKREEEKLPWLNLIFTFCHFNDEFRALDRQNNNC
jgi:hypothetical protein